jgi:hypothetical protein
MLMATALIELIVASGIIRHCNKITEFHQIENLVITLSYINKLIMKVIKYSLFLFFIFCISCNSNKEENLAIKKIPEATARVKTEKFKLVISHNGPSDNLIPNLIFLDSCIDRYELFDYYVMLKYSAYLELKEMIQDPNWLAELNTNIVVTINNKKGYHLPIKYKRLFFSKLLSLTEYKGQKILKGTIQYYLDHVN